MALKNKVIGGISALGLLVLPLLSYAAMATSTTLEAGKRMADGIYDVTIGYLPEFFLYLLPLLMLFKIFRWVSSKF